MIIFDRASIEQGGQLVVETALLHVRAGESWALIGRSGAGKSMLLAAAATAVPLHTGDILVDGHSVRHEPEAVRRLTGYAPDHLPAWPGVRAGEFLELFAAAAGQRGGQLAQTRERGLALAGLCGQGHARVDDIDAGRRKRLLLAKALLQDPQVLLLDDPFAGLDPLGRRGIERLVGDAHLMGRSVLAAVEDGRVPDCFTHLAVLRDGRIVGTGVNDPATFAEGRRWRFVIKVPGRSDNAVRLLRPLAVEPTSEAADTVVSWLDLTVRSPADLVAAVVRAGLPMEAAGYDPPWQAQLIDDTGLSAPTAR